MRPLAELAPEAVRGIRYVLTDIDDTITEDGKLPADAYTALWRLCEAGIAVIPVTGRPAGWCDLIARQWPVTAVIGENGAFAFYLERDRLQQLFHPAAPEPHANRERLMAIAREVFAAVPGTRLAKDQFGRLFDVAVDFREEPPHLDLQAAAEIQARFVAHGAQAKISSIHVNAWFGDYDKVSMAERFLSARCGLELGNPPDNRAALFCGDSPNDEPMFERFTLSVAVANIQSFVPSLVHKPAYVTSRTSANGFVELVDHLLTRP
jgi:HAD superfamily hydrolase (TIGR01484 family)